MAAMVEYVPGVALEIMQVAPPPTSMLLHATVVLCCSIRSPYKTVRTGRARPRCNGVHRGSESEIQTDQLVRGVVRNSGRRRALAYRLGGVFCRKNRKNSHRRCTCQARFGGPRGLNEDATGVEKGNWGRWRSNGAFGNRRRARGGAIASDH